MEELIKRLERVIATGAPDKDGMHPISAETVLEVVKSQLSTNLAEVGTNRSENPNNSDAISRQAAIEAIEAEKIKHGGYLTSSYVGYEMAEKVVKQLPPIQSEPHWIPVTERLPETTDAVLTTYIVNGDRSRKYVEESSYYGNDESWSSPWDEYRIAGTRIEVIAWMPLPEAMRLENK